MEDKLKICPKCGKKFKYEDMHYYYTTNGQECK